MELNEKALQAAIEATTTAGQRGGLRSAPVSRVVMEAAIAAYFSALRPGSETDGFVLVPVEPTEAMIDAYTAAADDNDGPAAMYLDIKGYRAMLAAAGGE